MKSITLPGSKSITNRDLILASLANGKTILKSLLVSDDTNYMIDSLKKIGINIVKNNDNSITIDGGVDKIIGNNLSVPGGYKKIYVGQSGTCMRFLIALFILNKKGNLTITGEERLNKRPIGDLLDGLKQMGIDFISNGDYPPVTIKPSKIINNKIKINGNSSSQFFTALLQVAPLLKNGLEIEVIGDLVSKPYIDITINEIRKFGVKIENLNYKKFIIKPGEYKSTNQTIEGDASALSYIANYIILNSGEIKIENIGKNTKQGDYKYLEKLKIFGLNCVLGENSTILESKGVKNSKINSLKEIDFEDMPDVSMSFMSLALFLKGNTKITGLQTLNLKECKRIDAMKNELKKLGVKVSSDEKSITIGELKKFPSKTVEIETYNDHRIAMVFGTLNTYIGNLKILNSGCVNKTYPNFWKDLEYLKK